MSGAPGVAASMQWASAFSALTDSRAAAGAAATSLTAALRGAPVDLVVVFLGAHHVRAADAFAAELKSRLEPACLIGVSAHGVISNEHEVESGLALTVIAIGAAIVAMVKCECRDCNGHDRG